MPALATGVSQGVELDPRIPLVLQGDTQAAHALVIELIPRVRNLVRYLVRGDADADDIAQDALIAVLRDLGCYRAEGPFLAWVDRIVARLTIRKLRARRAAAVIELRPRGVDLESVEFSDELLLRRAVVRMLDRLPIEQRHALVLHHVLDMTVPEIAAELDAPLETVRSRLRLGKRRLRELGFALDTDEEMER